MLSSSSTIRTFFMAFPFDLPARWRARRAAYPGSDPATAVWITLWTQLRSRGGFAPNLLRTRYHTACDRQNQREGAAFAGGALHFDAPTMRSDDLTHQRQPETRPFHVVDQAGLQTYE